MTSMLDRATNDKLIGPDWAMNLEICDSLNNDPGQAKDVVKSIKKRIGHKNPKIQLLALTLLETIVKNCSGIVHMHVAEREIPHKMAKIARKKPDFRVKEKILVLIDTWQEAFGGPDARYPQFFAAYEELLKAGIVFPKRRERSAPTIFTPTRASSQPTYVQSSKRHETEVFHDASDFPNISLTEMQNARGIMTVLFDMLSALDPEDKEGYKQEVILDLVHQCRVYRERLVHLVNSTSDEDLLSEGLALNDDLHDVVAKYDAIASGVYSAGEKAKTLQDLVTIDGPADTEQHQRTSINASTSNEQLLLTAPPTSNSSGNIPAGDCSHIDLLSFDDFDTSASENPQALVPSSGQVTNSATEQKKSDPSDTFSPNNDNGNNSTPSNAFDSSSANPSASGYFSTPQHSLYANGVTDNLGGVQHEQAAYGQVAHFNYADHNAQVTLANTSQKQSYNGVDDEDLPPPPWEIQPTQSNEITESQTQHMQGIFTARGMYPQMMHNGDFGGMNPALMQNNQQPGMYYSPTQINEFQGVHPQPMQGFQEQQGSHYVDQRTPYYSHTEQQEISQGMHGLSVQDSQGYMNAGPSHQLPTPTLPQSIRPSKSEDFLFGDLLNIAKSKQNKPTDI